MCAHCTKCCTNTGRAAHCCVCLSLRSISAQICALNMQHKILQAHKCAGQMRAQCGRKRRVHKGSEKGRLLLGQMMLWKPRESCKIGSKYWTVSYSFQSKFQCTAQDASVYIAKFWTKWTIFCSLPLEPFMCPAQLFVCSGETFLCSRWVLVHGQTGSR